MNEIVQKQHEQIVVNVRFLTRRITGLERYAIEISRQLKKIRPSLTFVAPKGIIHQSIAEELCVECFGILTGHLWEQIELPLFLHRKNNPLLINLVNTGPMWKYGLLTIHRAKNTNSVSSFQRLCEFIEKNEDSLPLIFPAHPRTEHFIEKNHISIPKNIRMIPPARYFDMMMLEKTQRGFIQAPAVFRRKPIFSKFHVLLYVMELNGRRLSRVDGTNL
ncbi:MAG: UDP-N-acetylglucosamine 2-epimerase [Bacteroidota bacterium]|jgi:hypothetical protein